MPSTNLIDEAFRSAAELLERNRALPDPLEPDSDYNRGYNEAIRSAREMRGEDVPGVE